MQEMMVMIMVIMQVVGVVPATAYLFRSALYPAVIQFKAKASSLSSTREGGNDSERGSSSRYLVMRP